MASTQLQTINVNPDLIKYLKDVSDDSKESLVRLIEGALKSVIAMGQLDKDIRYDMFNAIAEKDCEFKGEHGAKLRLALRIE